MMPKLTNSAALEPPPYACRDCGDIDCVCDLLDESRT